MKKTLALAVTAGFVAVPVVWAAAGLAADSGPAYLQVSSFSAEPQGKNLAKLSVTTMGEIPRHADAFIGSNPVVGLAWADAAAAGTKVFVTTIHPVLGRDSNQNPDAWHAHTATLAGGATAPNDVCVASIDATPTAGIQVHGDTMDVNVRRDELPFDLGDFDGVVGFTIQPDGACGSGLAVRTIVE